jgi:chromate transporter
MNVIVVYLLLLKAALTSFSGMASLPMVRNDFIVERHVLTDRQLNTAIVAGRTGPGPNGLYMVSVGYFVAGLPGAFAGFLAVITPAFLVLPLMSWMGRRSGNPRIRSVSRAVVLSSVGLLLSASLPLARDSITGALTLAIFAITFVLLSFTRVDSAWVVLSAAAAGLAAKLFS